MTRKKQIEALQARRAARRDSEPLAFGVPHSLVADKLRELASDRAQVQSGFAAQRAGVKWWQNPHESGSRAAYQWDQGHTAARKSPVTA